MKPKPFEQVVFFIFVDDLERSSAFYGETLGLKMVLDQGACRIYQAAPNSFLGVCSHRKPPEDRSAVILTLVSDDVDGWSDYLLPFGLEFEKPPQLYEKFNIYHLFVRDPDGYLVEIQQFRDPSWPKPV
jgi:catechol 2,3-dioxygenase-like lactoylglutathione lyase family enzyme